jgi:hypothetical protein
LNELAIPCIELFYTPFPSQNGLCNKELGDFSRGVPNLNVHMLWFANCVRKRFIAADLLNILAKTNTTANGRYEWQHVSAWNSAACRQAADKAIL